MTTGRTKDRILLVTGSNAAEKEIRDALGEEFLLQRADNQSGALGIMAFQLPDLIIADFFTEHNDSHKLLRKIRSSSKTKFIPFIASLALDQSKERIDALDSGADSCITYPIDSGELTAVVRANLKKIKEFYLISTTDELTRLFNRREFINKFTSETSTIKDRIISLAIFDIDFFKKVNDLYGHPTGDRVLMKLGELLKKRTSPQFFPARFGGEEFVILFPDIPVDEAHIQMVDLLNEFSDIVFEEQNQTFSVTFSAGLSEYPAMAGTMSELLSRADQALYTAKNEGRSRVYSFSPLMAHNDKFWQYMRTTRGSFVDYRSHDSITGLPYLPQLLELITDMNLDIQSIGVLILSLKHIYDIEEYSGLKNITYDLENITTLIIKSSEFIFPSDMYVGLSDIYSYEFIILFPSVVDMSFNELKFNEICNEICSTINEDLLHYNSDLHCASSILTPDTSNSRKIISEISQVRQMLKPFSHRQDKLVYTIQSLSSHKRSSMRRAVTLREVYHTDTLIPQFQYFSLQPPYEHNSIFEAYLNTTIKSADILKRFLSILIESVSEEITLPLLMPCLGGIQLQEYISALHSVMPDKTVYLMINEYHLRRLPSNDYDSFFESLPRGMRLGLDNCYIGREILNILSRFNFDILLLSENITRNLFLFKNRIKIISGLKIFLDQIGVPMGVKEVLTEEEYQISRDLNITYMSGSYPRHRRELKS